MRPTIAPNEVWRLSSTCHRGMTVRILNAPNSYTTAVQRASTGGIVAFSLSVAATDMRSATIYVSDGSALVGIGNL